MASGQVPASDNVAVYLGELSLDGQLRHTTGVLPMVALARDHGFEAVFVPAGDAAEASLIDGVRVMPVSALGDLTSHLSLLHNSTFPIEPYS